MHVTNKGRKVFIMGYADCCNPTDKRVRVRYLHPVFDEPTVFALSDLRKVQRTQ